MNNLEDIETVGANEYPFYEQEVPAPEAPVPLKTSEVPQGPGSNLDSDTIDGIQAVTAAVGGPNVLVATDATGKLPSSVIPSTTPSNGLVWLESQSPAASSSLTLSSTLAVATWYKIVFFLQQNTSSGLLQVRFNADSGNNYIWANQAWSSNATSDSNGGSAQSSWSTESSGVPTATNEFRMGEINFVTHPGDATRVNGWASLSTNPGSGFSTTTESSVRYDGAASLSSVTLLPSAGTFTGTVRLYKVI